MVSLPGCILYFVTTAATLGPTQFEGVATDRQGAGRILAGHGPSRRSRNPEFDQWVEGIKREKAALDLRQQQLNELQTRLKTERQALKAVTQTVAQLQAKPGQNVVGLKSQEIGNAKRQANVIASLLPGRTIRVTVRATANRP